MIWADALYLRSVPALMRSLETLDPDRRKGKLLRAISVALLYGYCDYAIELAAAGDGVFTPEEHAVIEGTVRAQGQAHATRFPGRHRLASLFRRLWRACRLPNQGWSVSDAAIGNRD
jgi:hypothetical protein